MSSGFWRAACGRGAVLAAALWLGAAGALAQSAPPEPPVIYQIQPGQSLVDGSHLWLLPPANTGGAPITKIHTFFTNPEDGVGYSANGDVPSPPYPIFPININGWFVDYATQAVFSVWAENSVGFSPTLVVSITTGLRAPTAPRNLRAETLDGEISLFWNIPLNSGGPPNSYYTSQYRVFYGGSTTLTIAAGQYIQPGLQYNIGKFAEQTVISVDTSAARGISIWARNAVGWGPVAVATAAAYSAPAAATTAPGAPVSLTVYFNAFDAYAQPQTPGQVRFFPPTVRANLATGFYILYNGQSVDISHTAGQTGQKTRNLTGLTRGNTVVFSVVAKGASGNGPAAVYSVRIPATAPGKPTNIRVLQANEQRVVFTWDAPTFWGGWGPRPSPYSRQLYRVNINDNNRFSGLSSGNVATNTVTIPRNNPPGTGNELEAGRRYEFIVLARSNSPNAALQNRFSDSFYFTIPGNPSPPQNLTGQPRSGQVVLSWDAPASWGEGGGGATDNARIVYGVATSTVSYTLSHNTNPSELRPLATLNPITINKLWTSSNVGENLINGVAYKFEVAVVNALGGVGTLSAPITVTPAAPVTPAAVQSVAIVVGDRSAVATWSAPSNAGSFSLKEYVVSIIRSNVANVYTVTSPAITITAHNNAPLVGDSHWFRVFARSQVNVDGPMHGELFTPNATFPDEPNVVVSALAGGSQISVSWSAALQHLSYNTAATAYAVHLGAFSVEIASATTATIIGNLQSNTAYTLSVWGISPGGAGFARVLTATTAAPSAPATPQNFRIISQDIRYGIVLAWDSPTNWGGSTLSVYQLGMDINFNSEWGTHETTATRHTITQHDGFHVSFLEDSNSRFRVRARSQAGLDSSYVQINGVVLASSPDAPNVAATALASGTQISVSWSKASNISRNNAATAYVVRLGNVDSTLAASIISTVVGGLQVNTAYTLSVQGVAPVGAGAARVLTITTAAGPPAAPSVVVSPTPDGRTPAQVTLSWSVPNDGGNSVTAYIFSYGTITATLQTSQTATVVSVSLGVSYAFTLRAVNSDGASPAGVITASIASPSPTPTGFRSEPCGRNCLILEWQRPTDDSLLVEYLLSGIDGGGRAVLNRYIPASGTGPVSVGKIGNFINTALPAIAPVVRLTLIGMGGGNVSYLLRVVRAGRILYGSDLGLSAAPTPQADTPTLRAVVSDASSSVYVSGATLFWSHPNDNGNAIQAYYLSYNDNVVSLASTATAYTPAGLVDGTQYAFTLQATNAIWMSEPGVLSVLPYSRPGDVSNIQYADIGNGRVSLSWNPPANTGGLSLLYFIEDTYATATHTANANSYTLGVAGEGTVTLTVNIAAAGNPSVSVFAKGGSVAAVVAVSAAPPLSAPQNFRVVSRDSRYGFVVAWDEPASWGGSTLSVYRVGLDVNSNGWATRETTDTRITISHYQGSHTNLWAGGSSRFRILARSQAGEDSARITINGGIISQSPNAPNVMATALAGGTQISVSWSKFSNNAIDNAATAYAVRLGGIDSTLAASITSTVVGNLSPGTPYTLSVHGISPIGKGPARVVVATTDFANPGKPLNVRAVEIGDGYVVIAWDEPSWGGSSMSLYRAYYRESGDSWNRIGGADITAYAAAYTLTQSGLTNGNAYHFHVLAQSQAGLWSDPPNSLNQAGFTPTLTASPVAVPSRPTIVATPNANGAQISLSWSANDNGETITAYLYSFNGGAVITLTGGITSTVETGLAKFSPYTLSLAAVNANGAGPSSVVVVTTQATNPGAPRNLVATPGDGFLIFTWDEPADWGGSTLSVYRAFFGQDGGPLGLLGDFAVASVSVSGANGTQYRFRVRARSQAGKNGPYTPFVIAAPAAVPSRPVVTAGINANGEEITLSWSASGGGITAFLYSFNGGAFVTLTGNTITSTVEAGLAKNSPHTLSLAAVNAGGTSPYTVAVFNTPATNPTPPRNVRTVEVGNGYVVFAWDEPADWGGSSLSVYQYAYREVGGTHAPFNQANNTATVSGLTNGTPYEFFVYAQSQATSWSDSSPTLTATPVALPSVSFATVIALASGTEISVSLLVDDGGNALTGLTLLYGGTAAVALSPTTRATVLSSLNITTAYTLSVIAVNSVGAATAVATATTPAPPPSAVQNLSLVSSDARVGFVFSWDAPTSWGGSALSVYRLSLNIASNDWQGYETTDTRITITRYGGSALHLWQSSPFFWARVIARSQAGVDSSHVQINGGNVAASPNAPIVAATALASGTEISVSWRKANNNANNNNATDYAIHLGTVAATLGGAITATVVGNLQGNTGYTLSVWAINPVGAGGIRALTLTTAVIPAPPGVSFAAVTALSSGTEISLSLLVDESGGALSGLTLLYGGTAAVALSPTTRATVLSSLSPTTAYTLSVIAVNAAGAATAVATATTPDLPTAPGAPSIAVFPTPDGVTPQRLAIVLSVSNNGGSPITNYRIRYGSSNYLVGVSGSPATHIITDTDIFVLDADFVFSFAAINAVGEGPAATATARANSTAPFAPTAFAAAPTPQGAMPAQVTLSWSAPPNGGKNITAYILSYGTVLATLPASQTLSVVGVSFDVAHSFTLRAANENGASPAAVVSASIAPLSAPDAPALNAAATPAGVTPAQVTLSWSAPANGGSPITAYFLSYGTVSATLPASANATVVSVLLDVAYLFTLQAANAVSASPAAVVAASIAPPVALPSMPQNLRVNVVGDVVVFEWNAPASNGGAAISEYLVYVNGAQTSAVTGLAANLSGLVDGNYNLGVAAVNSAGTGQRAQIMQSLSFAVLTEEKKKEIDKTILPAVAGVLSQQLANIVGDRIAAPAVDVNVGGNLNLLGAKLGAGNAKRGIAQMLKQHGGALANGGEVSESALRNGSFALPLAAAGDSAAGVKMGVWGGAAYGNMENEKSAIQYDGKNAAYYTGMDATFGDEESKTKVGAMFVHSRADANYTDAATGGAGEYNMHANSGKGYLGWSGKNYSAHGSFGFGKGEVKIQAAGGDSETRKVNLYSASAGGRAALLRGENGALWGEADWSIADIRFASGGGEGSRAQNLRAALEASQQIRFVSGGGVEPFMRAGYLRRFGETSANGWETGAGLRWSAAARWRGEFRARYAQYNSGDKQLGVAAVLRAEAANNRGLALSLTPQYNESAATMGAELTYGIATSAALWRPRLAAKIGEATEYQAGAQWQSLLQNRVALRAALTATRKQQTTALNLTFGARY